MTGLRYNFKVALICISPMARNVEHFQIYLLVPFISSFENCLFSQTVDWQNSFVFVFVFFPGVCVFNLCSSLYSLEINPLSEI